MAAATTANCWAIVVATEARKKRFNFITRRSLKYRRFDGIYVESNAN